MPKKKLTAKQLDKLHDSGASMARHMNASLSRRGDKAKLDKWHYHEVLDRASTLADSIALQLMDHPVVVRDLRLIRFVNNAVNALVQIQLAMAPRNADEK